LHYHYLSSDGDAQQTVKSRILLENDYLPGGLETSVGAFVERCNHCRYHESSVKRQAPEGG